MATSRQEQEKQAKRELIAKQFSNQYKTVNIDIDTRKKYDDTNFTKTIFK